MRWSGPILLAALALEAPAEIRLDTIKLPPGFRISVYSDAVPGARSMAMGPGGTLFVGSRDAGNVYALVDAGDGTRAAQVFTLAKDLNEPNGVAVKDGALYVMEISRLLRFDAIEKRLGNPPPAAVVTAAFPKDPHHGWKFIAFGPGRPPLRADRSAVQHLPAQRSLRVDHPPRSPTAPASRSSRAAFGTPSASTGTRTRRSCGSRTTDGTGSATTALRTS